MRIRSRVEYALVQFNTEVRAFKFKVLDLFSDFVNAKVLLGSIKWNEEISEFYNQSIDEFLPEGLEELNVTVWSDRTTTQAHHPLWNHRVPHQH